MNCIVKTDKKYSGFEATASQIAHNGLPADLVEIARGRNVVGFFSTDYGKINVKSFARPGIVKGFIYTYLRHSKARRSFEYAHKLIQMGFSTPYPVTYAECRSAGLLSDSYYFSTQVDAEEFRYVENRSDEQQLLRALGRELARLHKAGVWMRDFSPGNILFTVDSTAPDGYRFMYVDLNRMSFDVHDPEKLKTMFRSIVVYPAQVETIARSYAEAAGLPANQVVETALAVHRKFQDYLAKKRKFKKLLMPWRKSR